MIFEDEMDMIRLVITSLRTGTFTVRIWRGEEPAASLDAPSYREAVDLAIAWMRSDRERR